MSNVFLDDTGRRRRAIMVVVAVLAVAAVVLGLAYAMTRGGKTSDTAAHPAASASSIAVPSGPLKLIKGSNTVEGVGVGYPHSTAGAVSAAAEYLSQIGGTLDIDRSRTIGGIIADPSFADAGDYFANGAVNSRKHLGLPASGPVPTGASTIFGPAGYQLRSANADSMTVLILGYLTGSKADGTITSQVAAIPIDMHWTGQDWKVLKPASTQADYSALSATPNTADATAKGWTELTP